nr:myosin-14-like isoform X2 [Gasterosteus aculeatus aculeatus]
MRMKVTGVKELQKTYQHIHDHLQQEVREMEQARGRKEHAVSTGRAEVERLSRQLQAEAAALESSQGRLDELLRKKEEMKLDQLNAEERNLNRTPENQKGREIDGDEEKEEGAHSFHVTDHQPCDVSGASQSDRKLVEDMEALREALGVCHVQEIGPRVASLWATKERLLAEVTRYQDEIRQGAKAFAELELQHTKLKFTPSATRSDELRAEVKAEQDEKALRVQRLQADLKRSQALLDTAERGVNNLHFRMSCVPVEGLSSESPTDSMETLKDIRARLPMLLQRASEQEADSGLDQETVYTLCEQLNAMESRNAKALSIPTDASHLSGGEEDSAPSRAEIKRRSSRLIEAGRKKSSRGRRKQ